MLLTRCIYCDKLHLCTYNKANWSIPKRRFHEMMRDAIIPLISRDQRLQELFLIWSTFNKWERITIDKQIEKSELDLYTPLRDALGQWEAYQDTEGAPGFETGAYSFTCSKYLEEELLNAIYNFEYIVNLIRLRSKINYVIESQSKSIILQVPSKDVMEGESKDFLFFPTRFSKKSASIGL